MITIEQLLSNTNYSHSRNVAKISRIIAKEAGYSDDETAIIEQAALFHDVGKSDISPGVLNKPGRLTPGEYEIVKTHAEAGYKQIMEAVKTLTAAASVAREHHERLDGSGYIGIPGSHINPYARLIAVIDVFDALISRRSYKQSWDAGTALQYLAENENHFDSIIVGCLARVIDEVLLLYKTDYGQKPINQGA
jgi:HD-GYP domain-containing protein (c-di-GMP phosphodiesterase class II)